jgi:hypothetical protein
MVKGLQRLIVDQTVEEKLPMKVALLIRLQLIAGNGKWIFQAKFINTYENLTRARRQILVQLDNELTKITNNFPEKCDNYIMATNVSLSSARASGTIDKIGMSKQRPNTTRLHLKPKF